MIQNWLIPELKHTGIIDLVWFQHDGAMAYFVLTVNVIINRSFWDGGLIVLLQLHCHHTAMVQHDHTRQQLLRIHP